MARSAPGAEPDSLRGRRGSARVGSVPLGVIIYEMLAGAAPFHAKAAMAFMRQHMVAEPPSLRTRVPQVGKELHDLVHAMLAKEPQARPDMIQVGEQLRKLAGPSRVGDTLIVGDEPPRRAAAGWLVVTGILVLLLLAGTWILWGGYVAQQGAAGQLDLRAADSVAPAVAPSLGPQVLPAPVVRATADLASPRAAPDLKEAEPRRDTLDPGSAADSVAAEAVEADSAPVEPSPAPPVEPAEPPPARTTTPHGLTAKGKRPGKPSAPRSGSDTRHRGGKQRGKHARSR